MRNIQACEPPEDEIVSSIDPASDDFGNAMPDGSTGGFGNATPDAGP